MLLYELNNYVSGNVVYNDTLNPKIYDQDDNMRPEVHAALIAVSKNFLADLDLPNMVVHDIILTGSSANYNWTKFSDIDLHLISDVDVFADPHMAAKYFNAAKNVWNNKHDVDIRGLDVEVYIEDNDEDHVSLGRFSVMNNAWITKPDHNTPVFDEDAVNRKVRYLMKEIDMYMDDSDDITDIEHLKEKIWLMRNDALAKSRIEGTNGEFSVENLAFKVLRNMGYLDKILKALHDAEDRELSVNESYTKVNGSDILPLINALKEPADITITKTRVGRDRVTISVTDRGYVVDTIGFDNTFNLHKKVFDGAYQAVQYSIRMWDRNEQLMWEENWSNGLP